MFRLPRTKVPGPDGRRRFTPLGLLVVYGNVCLFGHFFLQYWYYAKGTWGSSMMPTMSSMNWVLISSRHRLGRRIGVGDIVSFQHPIKPEKVIKRVIGMPGDFVLRDTPGEGRGTMVQVPEGHCWVAGDNQLSSRDSRHFGPVPLALIKGKVIATIWPPSEFAILKNTLHEADP